MDYTQNLHLPQWEETDRIQMDDFNDAMASIDAAVPRIVVGSYVGSGAATRTISLGFTPRAVYVCRRDGLPGYTRDGTGIQHYGGLALDGKPALTSYGSYTTVEVAANGFTVYNDGAMSGTGGKGQYANYSGWTYYYVALK